MYLFCVVTAAREDKILKISVGEQKSSPITGPEGSRQLRFQDFVTTVHDRVRL